ncbi:MAG: tetratricopeptide repeat protein, partial [Bdellovibrionota bacterium]
MFSAWNRSAGLSLALALLSALVVTTQARPVYARSAYSDQELRSAESPDEAKIRDLRGQEINELRIALGRHPGTSRRADLYFRLAEIYVEAYRMEFLLEGRVHEKRLERGTEDKLIDRSHSKPYLSSGIKACQEILGFHIQSPRLDQVYYFLGFNYGELGDRKQSLRYFDELSRKFPQSPFVSEAYRELGDAAYNDANFRRAISYYESAVARTTADFKPRILHKLAWSYYRTKQYDRAVDTMKQAVAASSQSGEKLLSLKEEALRDMALFMTETGRVDEAIQYFKSVASDSGFYPRVLEKLGKQYERNVEPAKATQVYESLLKTNPESEEAFRVLVKLIDLDLRRGHFHEALARLAAVRPQHGGDSETQVAAQNLKAMVRRTATEHHEEYRKTKSKPALEVAESYYSAYLDHFLSQEDPRQEKPEIQMYLAEVKRDLGKSKEASDLYRKVIDTRDKRYAKEAGALWTASLAEAIRRSGAQKGTEPSDLEKEFIDAADRLQDALGATNEGREAALRAAQVLAGYPSSRKPAVKRIRRLISDSPRSPQALVGARLWLQLSADRIGTDPDAADETKSTIKNLEGEPALLAFDSENGGKLRAQMSELDSRLKIGAIAKEEKDQDFDGAAKGYENFAAEAATKDLAEKAFGNAVGAYLKAEDFDSIERVGNTWLKRYPKSAKAIESLRSVATASLIRGDFESSLKSFERLGREAGDGDSLETAALMAEGLGDKPRAERLQAAYLELYPASARRWAIAVSLGRMQESAGQDPAAAQAFKYCQAGPADSEAECGSRLADLYARAQDLPQAKAAFKKVAASKGNSPFIGYARFRLAEILQKEQRFEPMRLPEAQLKRTLNQRLEFLESLSRAYTSAVEAGGPFAISALDRLSSWVGAFADEVDQIAPPPGADPQSAATFRKNLKSVSEPLRKKAASTMNDAYSKALSAEILSPSLPDLADRLADARVPSPVRAQGMRSKFRIAGIPSDGGEDGQRGAFKKIREHLV